MLSLQLDFNAAANLNKPHSKRERKNVFNSELNESSLMRKHGQAVPLWGIHAYIHWNGISSRNKTGKRRRVLLRLASCWIDGRHFILTSLLSLSLSRFVTPLSEIHICHLALFHSDISFSVSVCLIVLVSPFCISLGSPL